LSTKNRQREREGGRERKKISNKNKKEREGKENLVLFSLIHVPYARERGSVAVLKSL
jgi:hypothetical protein